MACETAQESGPALTADPEGSREPRVWGDGSARAGGRWNWRRVRFIPLAAGAGALIWGLQMGLIRLGWDLPGSAGAALHGPLMICGFLGTLISLERAVAVGRSWAYAAPAACAAGAVALATGHETWAHAAILLASLWLTMISIWLCLRMPALFAGLLAIGAATWVVGVILWALGHPMTVTAGWWLTFLVLTITAERVELSRVMRPPWWTTIVLTLGAGLVLLGAARGELAQSTGYAMGAGLLIMTLSLLRFDVARITIRQRRRVRFSAVCMFTGYFWLATAGLGLALGLQASWIHGYDAAVHAIGIGFVLSMVFAHAPIILPAVAGVRLAYTALLYAPLTILHASLVARIAGDLLESFAARKAGGLLTAVAIATYAIVLLAATVWPRERRSILPRAIRAPAD
jgi:hypothetical protein